MLQYSNIEYPNALHFTLTTPDELYDLYITVLEHTTFTLTIELWCPQTTLFNTSTTIPYCDEADKANMCKDDDITPTILSFLNSHLHQIGFDCNIEDLE